MRHHITALLAAAALAVPLVGASTTAATGAAGASQRASLANHLVSPLSIAAKPNGTVFVSQNFEGLLTKVVPGKAPKVVLTVKKAEVGALSVRGGTVTFGVTKNDGTTLVKRRTKDGSVSTLAKISNYEADVNPDSESAYGVVGISDECAADWPQDLGPATYTGIVESHVYATEVDGDVTYVADAAANAIFKVAPHGTVSTVAVLPPVPIKITQALADDAGAPDCVVGMDYYAEPVPTDIELGPDGVLYVTSLPGGPGESVPAGSVLSVDPANGDVATEVSGLFTPVGLAITAEGDMYVAQLFSGEVAKVPAGSSTPELYKTVPMPGALDVVGDTLYATTKVLDEDTGGKLVSWAL